MAELLSRISSAELTEWAAYMELEPFGPEWENWRAGIVASTVANVQRGKNQKPYRASDFMPGVREKRPSVESIKQAFSIFQRVQ